MLGYKISFSFYLTSIILASINASSARPTASGNNVQLRRRCPGKHGNDSNIANVNTTLASPSIVPSEKNKLNSTVSKNPTSVPTSESSSYTITGDQLKAIMGPNCGKAPASPPANYDSAAEPIDCASEAPTLINSAMAKYGIKSKGAAAFLLSYLKDESGSLAYAKNHFPGRPGQGTRSMAMPATLYKFATDPMNANLSPKVTSALQGKSASDFQDGDKQGAELLAALLDKQFQFLPSAWLMTGAFCPNVKKGLLDSGKWEDAATMLKDCLGVGDAAEARKPSWELAMKSLP